ncbi:MAG: tetratricopeptide repeat protein [Hoeflea sp.]|uniref:tetratricopeptide repeat protein n=1 Tax=Hoeflea sp. TaxID=1940281 RepID=UPI001D9283C3|nr:tetratricopeptide repeat protein [Hoeflea sp.]MBU4527202.1 tetratricopeptide repeat protein [Alphaproteobacteria bacterium]MBU4547015.1 tetratricopeptide repeat protein [Alphaproteobacteria bacterium]MBU4551473.1 tetratricopeptide repeat protein [Alphaproteobacteria bacterium]MBV1725478.1 tetratricopeptide repeat protein [Hoeflea sp.]MBV1759526.1 tetratricopeptide repeat protein [Hoeflea sp.]
MSRHFRAFILAATLGAALSGPAGAAGETESDTSNTVKTCKDGEVWDKRENKCVVPKEGALDDDSLYEAGRDLAYAGRYGEAISVLSMASDRNDKRILNFLGYAHRKDGRLEVGIGYYRQAIDIDPTYTLVREYYGEALLTKGDVAGARTQLAAIELLCGSQACEEYEQLAAGIAAFKTSGKTRMRTY